jgi:hypothetical protein
MLRLVYHTYRTIDTPPPASNRASEHLKISDLNSKRYGTFPEHIYGTAVDDPGREYGRARVRGSVFALPPGVFSNIYNQYFLYPP